MVHSYYLSCTLSVLFFVTWGLIDGHCKQAKPKRTPFKSNTILQRDSKNWLAHSATWEYWSVIGKLNFLEKLTCPDISYVVHQCAKFSINPKWHILRPYYELASTYWLWGTKGSLWPQNPICLIVGLMQTLMAIGPRSVTHLILTMSDPDQGSLLTMLEFQSSVTWNYKVKLHYWLWKPNFMHFQPVWGSSFLWSTLWKNLSNKNSSMLLPCLWCTVECLKTILVCLR